MNESFLRSINVLFDADKPERIAHFRPTSKSVSLIRGLLGLDDERAIMVIAPYGTGKSISAMYSMHLIENNKKARDILQPINHKLQDVNTRLGEFAFQRIKKKTNGLVLLFHGYTPDLPNQIKVASCSALHRVGKRSLARSLENENCSSMEDAISFLIKLRTICAKNKCDRILILWDEFGKHLETSIAEGKHSELLNIQLLAEFVSRTTKIPVTLGLLLHQGLLQIFGNITQSLRKELTKIEGRFKQIQYIDDSREVYELIAEVADEQFNSRKLPPKKFIKAVKDAKESGIFQEFNKFELRKLFRKAYPLDPVTLFLLPRVASRIAQNERTLFHFIYSNKSSKQIGPEHLYDYFSPQMRSDTSAGGTYRHWIETESAISKVFDKEDEVRLLKTVCLLSLGIAGERGRARKSLVQFSFSSYNGKDYLNSLDSLLEKKLLLYRKRNDELTLWHGADVDLKGRLADEKARVNAEFDLLTFLKTEMPPPVWRPLEHNSKFGIQRYFLGNYETVESLSEKLSNNKSALLSLLDKSSDGIITYLIPSDEEDLDEFSNLIQQFKELERFILVIPRDFISIYDVALEVSCLERMMTDNALIGEDPLILSELKAMIDDSRKYLQNLLEKIYWPKKGNSKWFYKAEEFVAESPKELRSRLSAISDRVFNLTPNINNELIVKRKPSPVIVNSRKKFLMGVLERSGTENLGLVGYFPDSSIFRTVLLHTGLYVTDDGERWYFQEPEKLADPGLRAVWAKIKDFFTVPSNQGKPFSSLINEILEPPYGVKEGLIPILLASGMVAFPSAISLQRKNEYVLDILPSNIEDICKNPDDYSLIVIDLNKYEEKYLRLFYTLFSPIKGYEVPSSDLIRLCFDALQSWVSQLPPAVQRTDHLNEETQSFRELLFSNENPVDVILFKIPSISGVSTSKPTKLINRVALWKEEIEDVIKIYLQQAKACITKTLLVDIDLNDTDVTSIVRNWGRYFSEDFINNGPLSGISKSLMLRMKNPYDNDAVLIDSISYQLLGKSLSSWNDETHFSFEREFKSIIYKIEEVALNASTEGLDGSTAHGIIQLAETRIRDLANRIESLAGRERTSDILSEIREEINIGSSADGKLKRSAG